MPILHPMQILLLDLLLKPAQFLTLHLILLHLNHNFRDILKELIAIDQILVDYVDDRVNELLG